MWRLECFVICAPRWHTCKLHLLGMRPQIATHNNNPRTLPWTFIIFERKKSVRLDLRVADRQTDPPQEGVQGTTSKNGLQHCSLKCGVQHMPRSHRTAWQHSRKRGWGRQGTQRCSASVLKGGTTNYLRCRDTHQQGNTMMQRDSIPPESNFWEQCKWWTCTGGLTLFWQEFQHNILSKIN